MIVRCVLALICISILSPSSVVVRSFPASTSSASAGMCASSSSSLSSPSRGGDNFTSRPRRRLPPDVVVVESSPSHPRRPIVIGYAHDASSGKAERAILDGCDIIVWSFLHLDIDQDDDGTTTTTGGGRGGRIRTALDLDAIGRIRNAHADVIHLAAFGGWNGPHPPSSLSSSSSSGVVMTGRLWFEVFDEFNLANGDIFDGIDWDYEGHDDLSSPTSRFTLETLDAMVEFSIEAKARGYIVSMAPAESYLDPTIEVGGIDAVFSTDLDLLPRSWTHDRYGATDDDRDVVRKAGFSHAGRQCYAYVLAKAGMDTFDWISLQLYEAYSPFAHDVHRKRMVQDEALMMRIRRLVDGYTIEGLPLDDASSYEVRVPPSKLVIGIANGWADGMKFCRVDPTSIRRAYETTVAEYGRGFLGVMFWTVEEEGSGDDADDRRVTHSLRREFEYLGP
jgi:hypothetical protein